MITKHSQFFFLFILKTLKLRYRMNLTKQGMIYVGHFSTTLEFNLTKLVQLVFSSTGCSPFPGRESQRHSDL